MTKPHLIRTFWLVSFWAGTVFAANPVVTGPVAAKTAPGNAVRDYPFFAALEDLKARGYVEEEYFVAGTANLGQTNVEEDDGKPFHRTKVADVTTVYVTNNQHMVDVSIAAVKDNNVPRTQVQCPGRKGLHGGEQGPWYGLGSIANRNRIPGTAVIGALTGYWTSTARLESLDVNLFLTQMASACQMCGSLMLADLESINGAR